MATVVAFLRGVNVGGHRRFRPSLLAKQLARHDVVNIGATGLLVARKAKSLKAFRVELAAALPFETDVALCDGREFLELVAADPLRQFISQADIVPFVSVAIESSPKSLQQMPLHIPEGGEWYVRVIGQKKRFFLGVYRRHMNTIGYLGRIDAAVGTRVTTRNWNTALAAARALGLNILAAPR